MSAEATTQSSNSVYQFTTIANTLIIFLNRE
jgi:hypothetical protein